MAKHDIMNVWSTEIKHSQWSDEVQNVLYPAVLSELRNGAFSCLNGPAVDLMDVCTLEELCVQYRPKALTIVYETKKCLNGMYRVNSELRTQDDLERIFKHFGSNLRALQCEKRFLFDLMAKHCSDNFKALKIVSTDIPTHVTVNPIFQRLQVLHLRSVKILGDRKLFSGMDSLVELSLESVENSISVLANLYPKLETFTYYDSDRGDQCLAIFLSCNSKLKELRMNFHCNDKSANIILLAIATCCKKLERLFVNVKENREIYLEPLQNLTSLQTLELWHVKFRDLHVFSRLVQLRELKLCRCRLPKFSNIFTSMAKLTTLEMDGCDVQSLHQLDVAGIVQRLPDLRKLRLSDFVLTEDKFCEIIRIVSVRPHKLSMHCKYDFDVGSVFDENKLFQQVVLTNCS